MKKTLRIVILAAIALAGFSSHAQVFEITPSYGYQFGSKLNYGSNYLKMEDSGMFGITLGYEVRPRYMLEASYINMGSELRIRDRIASPQESRLADLNADWFMFGGTRYFGNDKVKPFFGGQLGFSVFSPNDVDRTIAPRGLDSITKFSFGFKGGVVVMLTDKIGLNFQGNLLFPVEWGGFYVGAGTGGVSTGINAGSTLVIGGFSGGLVFRLGA
ncbi:MAG: outer membrane beta-barrel protein [Robiginitalea sp.]|uniref:outer membrane beta-barrel protein n=1 Tax=Robiginitalea sp. TaxID=1902411 RepID=UPI003C71FA6D